MVYPVTTQRQLRTAKDQVFASGDLVYLFKACFTLHNFALNRTFLRFAWNRQIDIDVSLRPNVDLYAYQKAAHAGVPFKVREILWPARLNPTSDPFHAFDLLDYFVTPEATLQANIKRLVDLMIMTKMLDTHAPHVHRLEIHMSLGYHVSEATHHKHINDFLAALAKCTAVETLVITQSDHIPQDAKLTTIQCRLFDIIKTMHRLRVLDFSGNMTIEATNATIDPISGTQNQLTMIDYLPPSLCELVLRDGPKPRMFKWVEFYGFSAGLKLALSNDRNRFPLLKSIALPSSFWSLMPHQFGGFVLSINSQHITNIRFSDPFKLNQRPFKPVLHGIPIPKPKHALHYLLATLVQDMLIDLRGADDAERATRIDFFTQIITSSVIQPVLRSDGPEYTTITLHKSYNCIVQVLI